VELVIGYDPEILCVVDCDEENWITRGVNIFDGKYHREFPFDFHIRNEADNLCGKIIYKMGSLKQNGLTNSGDLAQIKFQALKGAEKTWIWFKMPGSTSSEGTKVNFRKNDVLGKKDVLNDGVKNLPLKIASVKS